MKHYIPLALLAVGMAGAHAATTAALYEFNGNFNPVAGSGASALVSVDPLQQGAFVSDVVNGVDRTVFRFAGSAFPWTSQGGLQFVNADLMNPNSYSIEAYSSFDAVSGWRRIIDTRDRTEDTGFYVLNGGLQLYPSNVGAGTFERQCVQPRDPDLQWIHGGGLSGRHRAVDAGDLVLLAAGIQRHQPVPRQHGQRCTE